MNTFRGVALVAACCLTSPAALAADASLHTYAQIYTSDGASVPTIGTDSASATVDRDGLHAEASAHANYGAVDLHALATATPEQRDLTIGALAGAAMVDTFAIHLNPVPSPPPPPYSEPLVWSFLATVIVTGEPAQASLQLSTGAAVSQVALHSGVNEVSAAFTGLGQPIRVAISATVDTESVGGPFQRSSTADASIRWGGISSVRLGEFGPVPVEITTTSGSGYDWALAAPIPEPATVALFALALGAAGVRCAGGHGRKGNSGRRPGQQYVPSHRGSIHPS